MNYLEADEILIVHARVIEATGGSHGVRDVGLLQSSVARPRTTIGGKNAYKTEFEKGASLLEALARYHIFVDGNKRTAFASAARFLAINKYELDAENKEVELFMVRVVEKRLDVSTIALWLKKNSKRVKKSRR